MTRDARVLERRPPAIGRRLGRREGDGRDDGKKLDHRAIA
jgi:hypothetical protein